MRALTSLKQMLKLSWTRYSLNHIYSMVLYPSVIPWQKQHCELQTVIYSFVDSTATQPCLQLCEEFSLFTSGCRFCVSHSINRTQWGPTTFFLRPQWSRAGLWPHDGERCLCKSENKFSPWLAWAMAQWGFIVPAKVIRESNCVLYCPRMSGPNWARVPHPSTHDGVCLCVCMKACSTPHMLACMMHYMCTSAHIRERLCNLVCIFTPM